MRILHALKDTLAQRGILRGNRTHDPLRIFTEPGCGGTSGQDQTHADIKRRKLNCQGFSERINRRLTGGVDRKQRYQRRAFAGLGLNAGFEVWYSVCGGLFPETAKAITQAAANNDPARVTARLDPLWALYRKQGGSIRVIAAAAGEPGLTDPDCLPRPLLPLPADDIAKIAQVITELELS